MDSGGFETLALISSMAVLVAVLISAKSRVTRTQFVAAMTISALVFVLLVVGAQSRGVSFQFRASLFFLWLWVFIFLYLGVRHVSDRGASSLVTYRDLLSALDGRKDKLGTLLRFSRWLLILSTGAMIIAVVFQIATTGSLRQVW
jgi:hypothetical protein